jgi:cytochrome c oxidase subunit 4
VANKHKTHPTPAHGGHGAHGAHGGGHGSHAHAQHGITRYIVVWATLLVFTVLTVITGKMDLGTFNIWLAMGIALTKATLVVLFFMHLYDEGGVNRMVFVVSLLFVAVLLLGTFGDLMTRNPMTLPNEGPVGPTQTAPAAAPAGH